ncbi:TonB-dependent receptor plug domain-containing protein [Solimonas sp. K1W22B-7]|uniref:TonB-dependent receptor plug domain-containing protein n=1 Tax=Solimonas sp. K1W22B-7 TaxID=2303331 RepID=UPI0013C43C5E|nr:Plug domain-containing protein [Solimonas sp. K1W22B-7]
MVTATKRDKALSEIPASIVSVSAEELERRGIQGVEDIVKLVPGVNLTADLGIPRITIRGIAAETGTNLTTGVLFGNISFVDSYVPVVALDPNPFDLQSVEILKGPQGTLFGASALNGAIRYVPAPPQFGEMTARYFTQSAAQLPGSRRRKLLAG